MSVIPDKSDTHRPQVPAADQTLRILRHLARRPAPVAASSLARDLGIPRSTIYHLLATLETHGFVVHLPQERRWGLGTSAFELAGGYARQEPLARLGRPVIAALADQVGESAHLAVMSGRDVLYIVEERAARRPALVTDVGVRLPAHLTATGRAMLSMLPQSQVRALYPDAAAFTDRTGHGPARPSELREVLREARTTGIASEDGEVTPEFRSVAVAVRDHAGWPAAAVAVTWEQRRDPKAADAVRAAARTLEKHLGYSKGRA
ncbi:IclR family transcriptional regulator [Microbacterium esteraromaticum]|uniref:IclR family transcriptional regulator n=1 Tax=Microbacterium esteraromaticum TaxID=57043 RepID=UPI001C96129D|nr:IclR family transcriptional regulator [Microbacterium esteraromaticum]MBY6062575.1 IclR family transcriptional regulator [Microbacterium esteraromaticum]